MTDSITLLAEYVQTGSESAFRELVSRYLDLVYSTALRRVGGDPHLAQDVVQLVFLHLARKGHRLSGKVLLGGWLHRDTCYVAAKLLRSERRRQERERHALELQTVANLTPAHLNEVAPFLDQAIDQLGEEDRLAILLRFFERRDFRSVGAALGSNEDAARMRVNRALAKLHGLLQQRGVTLSTAAFGTALAAEAVTAAPAGLAASIASSAMAGTALGGAPLAWLQLLTMSKLKLGILGMLLVAGALPLVFQHRSQTQLREENQALRQQIDQLGAENERLANVRAQADPSPPGGEDSASSELLRLRNQAGLLRQAQAEAERLKVEQQALRQQLQAAVADATETRTNREQRVLEAKKEFAGDLATSVTLYWVHHGRQIPETLQEVVAYALIRENIRALAVSNGISEDQFELMTRTIPPANSPQTLLLREKEPWQQSDGTWVRVYATSAGGARVAISTNGDFSVWEQARLSRPDAL